MFTKSMIALVAFLVVAGTASAMDLTPSWAPAQAPLVPGQVYRTGSPLSRPGLGLFGALADSLTGGAFGSSTGIRTNGGGAVMFTGAGFVPVDPSLVPDDAGCDGVEINGECIPAMTLSEAAFAQESINWETVENAERVSVPVTGEACHQSPSERMKMAVELWDAGQRGSVDCYGQPVTTSQNCPAGQRLMVAYVEDATLGARAVYFCEVSE